MKQVTTNGFYGGINRDLSKHLPQNTTMYDNRNFRINTEEGQSFGDIENVTGNSNMLTFNRNKMQVEPDEYIIGHCVVRDDIVLFATNERPDSIYAPTKSKIYLYKYDYSSDLYADRITLYEDSTNELNLKKLITTIGRYENEYIMKVYWTDNVNNMRYINYAPDIDPITQLPYAGFNQSEYSRANNQDIEDFELLQEMTMTQPKFKKYTSGSLISGIYQYGYRLYNLYGSESIFSVLSKPIPVSTTISKSDTQQIKGNDVNTLTGIGIELEVEIINQSKKFDRIELISVHYTSENSVPTINILSIEKLTDDVNILNVVDTGIYKFGQITLPELLNIRNDFTCKTIESKDDRLFIGNIKETYFDVEYDARAYRFANDGTGYIRATIYDALATSYINVDDSNWDTVPYDHDCVNIWKNRLSNDEYVNATPRFDFKYQINGTTVGGSGPNVSYSFMTSAYPIADNIDVFAINAFLDSTDAWYKYYKEWTLGINRGFQRDEIYRFGLVLFNKKGQQSFVKWIGDIRMPTIRDYPTVIRDGANIKAVALFPSFQVSNIPDGYSYQIVYVPRTDAHKTVISQCFVNGTTFEPLLIEGNEGAIVHKSAYPKSTTINNIFELSSPELDTKEHNLDNMKLYLEQFLSESDMLYNETYQHGVKRWTLHDTSFSPNDVYNDVLILNIEDSVKIPLILRDLHIAPSYKLGNATYSAQLYDNESYLVNDKETYNPFMAPLHLVRATPLFNTQLPDSPMIGYIRRDVIPYGGDSYSDRTTDTYIVASELNNGISQQGDVFVNYYERLVSFPHLGHEDDLNINIAMDTIVHDPGVPPRRVQVGRQNYGSYVSESVINTQLMHHTRYRNIYRDDLSFAYGVADNSQFHYTVYNLGWFNRPTVSDDGVRTRDWTDYNLYNNVYSQGDKTKMFIHKPIDWQKQITFDTRIRYSNLKFNGEERDSWLQFMPNNFNEVDSTYGQLNQLVNFRNELFCFQEAGLCIASVNQQVLETSDTGIATSLGQGEVLPKQFNYNYGSTSVGIQDDNKVIQSLSAMYWIDINKRKMYRFNSALESFSDTKGIKAYLNHNIDNNTYYIGIYDNEYAEVLFTWNDETLVFSESLDVFQGWYSVNADLYIKTPRDVISSNNMNVLWKHNVGNKCEWYDTKYWTTLSIIVNGQGSITREYNNIEYMDETYEKVLDEYLLDVPNETFDKLQASNDFMTSDRITLKPYVPNDTLYTGGLEKTLPQGVSNIRRRMRMWRTVVPRVEDNTPNKDNPRFRDGYVMLTFWRNNDNNYRYVVHPINTYYTLSNLE